MFETGLSSVPDAQDHKHHSPGYQTRKHCDRDRLQGPSAGQVAGFWYFQNVLKQPADKDIGRSRDIRLYRSLVKS
mgnify:CR=1 FL=1